jgi:hypothetical protein
VTNNGRYGYVVNAGTAISRGCDRCGWISNLLNAVGVTAVTGGNPTDIALSIDSQYAYVLVNASSSIVGFAIEADGSLEPIGEAETPGGLAGLAGY